MEKFKQWRGGYESLSVRDHSPREYAERIARRYGWYRWGRFLYFDLDRVSFSFSDISESIDSTALRRYSISLLFTLSRTTGPVGPDIMSIVSLTSQFFWTNILKQYPLKYSATYPARD